MKLSNETIVCISYNSWDGPYTKSDVQLLSHLAKDNTVVYVEYPFTLKDVVTTMLGKQHAPVKRMLGLKNRLQEYTVANGNKVHHLVMPPMIPIDFIKWDVLFAPFYAFNMALYARTVNKALRKMNKKSPIIMASWNPFWGSGTLNKFKEKLNLYYCYDGIDSRKHGARIFLMDEAYSKSVDAIIGTSDFIKSEKQLWNPKTYVVKNGVDYTVFGTHVKKLVHERTNKTIGYIGSIDYRFDVDLMEEVIREMTNVFFEFIGDLRNVEVYKRLNGYANVTFKPPIAAHDVPAVLATYDLGIIPYTQIPINKNVYPLKINEYLAVGLPVVMTNFAVLPEFKDYVGFATTAKDFVALASTALSNDSVAAISARTAFAESNSWEHKATDLGATIAAVLQTKTAAYAS